MAFFGRFFGRAGSEAAGIALGATAVPALLPAAQYIVNEAWLLHPDRPPDAYVIAAGVAQGQVEPASAQQWANEQGLSDGAFKALVDAANTGPALGEAYRAWRRGKLSEGEFETAMTRAAIEPQWFEALKALKQNPLDPAQIATAVHRNIMRDASLIVREPPTAAGDVEQVSPSPLDPATEATWSGIDHERLRVLVGITGLPPGLIEMLRLLNMGKMTVDDVQRGVAQSNLRNEYMDVVLNLRRRLLTPHEYQEAALRGIITEAQADAGSALSGMEAADAKLIFGTMGRPLAVHQITQGLAHGVTLGGGYNDVPEPYRDAIRRSNIRPEYAKLAYANRYTYPSAFVLRALTQSGDITETEAHDILTFQGWEPALAAKVSAKWAGGTAAKGDMHTAKAQTQLWTTTHASYKAGEIDDAAVTAALPHAGVDTASIPGVLAVWQVERGLVRATLSAADIRKALQHQVVNEATGVAWTKPEAIAALVARGWDAAEASQYLDIS